MTLEAQIEAILLWRAEPLARPALARALGRKEGEIGEALDHLAEQLTDRGVQLIQKDNEVALGTHPAAANLIEKLNKEELSRDLGRASLETLTIVLYQGPLTRAEIDYIRGVNSGFILRHLMVRDLVERIENPKDARSFLYRPSFNLLQYLGLRRVEELPDYQTLRSQVAAFTGAQASAPAPHDH